jgi:predicted HNH restriction endonuclease
LESGPALAAIASGDISKSNPPSIPQKAPYREGAVRQVSRNEYERDPDARQRCIEHYGCRCFVCGFDFGQVYGEIGSGFIHVHHLKPLSEIRKEYVIEVLPIRPTSGSLFYTYVFRSFHHPI